MAPSVGIMMLTPNGRFQTNTRLCLSMSDFHPESWNPMWSVASILTGLLSFMLEETPTLGSVKMTTKERQRLAQMSHSFNIQNSTFTALFPDLCRETQPSPPTTTTTPTTTTASAPTPPEDLTPLMQAATVAFLEGTAVPPEPTAPAAAAAPVDPAARPPASPTGAPSVGAQQQVSSTSKRLQQARDTEKARLNRLWVFLAILVAAAAFWTKFR
eukprot:TRINITY_DN2152_c0_g1_i1.p2 TRINITY_DN2152_c0_g1~~TRINITY_DN2152_c0_g1_i1.p2  ORF type:complete len:214 (+),score=36.02 TRINITY_DN2152_c0_g1_i1:225-866(+)